MADYADDDIEIIDPGAPLFLGTLLFCVCSFLALQRGSHGTNEGKGRLTSTTWTRLLLAVEILSMKSQMMDAAGVMRSKKC